MLLTVVLALVVLVNATFAVTLVKDLHVNRRRVEREPGNPILMAISQAAIYFLSTFGISDFAIGAALYPKAKWVPTKRLPGTLNTACVLPVAVMALAYITSIEVSVATLLVAVIAQVVGAFFGAPVVAKLPARTIKIGISVGLLVAGAIILLGKVGLFPAGGMATGLTGGRLVLFGVLCLVFGALNNIGIGSYALTMATVYALGMNPGAAFPIMMAACTFSVPVGAIQFVRHDAYARKLTLFSAIFGSLGVLVAVFFVKNLDVAALQWVVLAVILYSAVSMLLSLRHGDHPHDHDSDSEPGSEPEVGATDDVKTVM